MNKATMQAEEAAVCSIAHLCATSIQFILQLLSSLVLSCLVLLSLLLFRCCRGSKQVVNIRTLRSFQCTGRI